jgi:hypothetical protein
MFGTQTQRGYTITIHNIPVAVLSYGDYMASVTYFPGNP